MPRASRPPPYLGPLAAVPAGLAGGGGGEPGQPAGGQAVADQHQRRPFGQRVVLQPGEQPGRQRLGQEGAAMGV
ncbi:MAG TPA: hypothetical protein VHV09_02625, partial [Trebonia sp.]|nr:hypothetical protein [Trebonia sp.]